MEPAAGEVADHRSPGHRLLKTNLGDPNPMIDLDNLLSKCERTVDFAAVQLRNLVGGAPGPFPDVHAEREVDAQRRGVDELV